MDSPSTSRTLAADALMPGALILWLPVASISVMLLTGRPPFDFAEAESELVAGILTELAGPPFSFALLAEASEWLVLAGL